ncbi:MAG TPA: DUF84 family protein [Thermoanaerobaculia bacterium]|nr:DUF84 family protein [Thermoanaerobaculia bacterium]
MAAAVASTSSEKLLGVRDGLLRYFREGLGRSVPVAVVPQPDDGDPLGLPISDAESLALARTKVRAMARRLGDEYHLYVASEGALQAIEIEGTSRWTLRSWSVIVSPVGEAVGGSAAVELPPRLIEGLAEGELAFAVPGTRRAGGLMRSLTGGLEDRRSATAQATANALSTLFFGMLESRPGRRRG